MAAAETCPGLDAETPNPARAWDAARPELTLVIPAYNEAARLPAYLAEVRPYLASTFGARYEVIVVDDGSRDGTARLVEDWGKDWPQLSILLHKINLGKGAAVRTGVLAALGQYVLFADADGSTPIDEETKLRDALTGGADLAVGSRLLCDPGTLVSRPWHRELVGRLFAWLAQAALRLPVRDTQCGFKMFRGETGRRLFLACEETGYLFDLHILILARREQLRIDEVAIQWEERPHSKVNLIHDSWRMLLGLARLRAGRKASDFGHSTVNEKTFRVETSGGTDA